MMSGRVKWFSDEKGYGFLEVEGRDDVFVHYSVIEGDGFRSLEEGSSVEFEMENGPNGDRATRVVKLQTES